MPEISLFYGIRVTMYYDDHNPPHFHAEYNGNKAIVEIDGVRVIKGALPSKQLKLILAWCVLHQDELMQNWELAKDNKPLNKFNPLISRRDNTRNKVGKSTSVFPSPQSLRGAAHFTRRHNTAKR